MSNLFRASRALKLTQDNGVVEADQPDGRFKLVDAGGFITAAQAAEYGLTGDALADFGLVPADPSEAHPHAAAASGLTTSGEPSPVPARIGLGSQVQRPAPRRTGASAKAASSRAADSDKGTQQSSADATVGKTGGAKDTSKERQQPK